MTGVTGGVATRGITHHPKGILTFFYIHSIIKFNFLHFVSIIVFEVSEKWVRYVRDVFEMCSSSVRDELDRKFFCLEVGQELLGIVADDCGVEVRFFGDGADVFSACFGEDKSLGIRGGGAAENNTIEGQPAALECLVSEEGVVDAAEIVARYEHDAIGREDEIGDGVAVVEGH